MGQVETLQPVQENGRAGHVWKTFNLEACKKEHKTANISPELQTRIRFFFKIKLQYTSAKYLASSRTKWIPIESDV